MIQSRVNSKTPVQYTRRLKTKKHKKLKNIGANNSNLGMFYFFSFFCISLQSYSLYIYVQLLIVYSSEIYNRPPKFNDEHYVPASFKQMLLMKDGKWKTLFDPGIQCLFVSSIIYFITIQLLEILKV